MMQRVRYLISHPLPLNRAHLVLWCVVGSETVINFNIAGEIFTLKGLMVEQMNYLEVLSPFSFLEIFSKHECCLGVSV